MFLFNRFSITFLWFSYCDFIKSIDPSTPVSLLSSLPKSSVWGENRLFLKGWVFLLVLYQQQTSLPCFLLFVSINYIIQNILINKGIDLKRVLVDKFFTCLGAWKHTSVRQHDIRQSGNIHLHMIQWQHYSPNDLFGIFLMRNFPLLKVETPLKI